MGSSRRRRRGAAHGAQVEELLSEESMERMSVGALKKQLVELQREVNDAHDRLHLTQVGGPGKEALACGWASGGRRAGCVVGCVVGGVGRAG